MFHTRTSAALRKQFSKIKGEMSRKVATEEMRSYSSTCSLDSHVDKLLDFWRENGVFEIDHGQFRIEASRYIPGESVVDDQSKIVHFQRHGQGYHNLVYGILADAGAPVPDVYLQDASQNPFVRPEMVDCPLTELGREQCLIQQENASKLTPELLIVSPLHRAIQTALITFQSFRGNIPFIAHEECREELGLLTCNKRRPLSETIMDYPDVDFSVMSMSAEEHDNLWDPHFRECPRAQSRRVYRFLADFLRTRREKEIAVVCHSAWLFSMSQTVLDLRSDEDLKTWFKTGEIRSMLLRFDEK